MLKDASTAPLTGGEFLLRATPAESVFTPEDFTSEHRAIAKTADDFWKSEIAPRVEAIQHQEPGIAVQLLRKSAELGLTSVLIPEEYGGMQLDLTSSMIVAEQFGRDGSYSAWHGAQTGIGTLPVLLFGTEQQKRRYLPKLATCEIIAAYCLSEPQAGSDALAARTTAKRSADGTHYVLNGQKMWITNGGAADLYTIFANVEGKLTAFLVERTFEGVRQGAEEKKMGIKGSSTCAIYLDNVRVPAENLLGEEGRGHVIAFNILNLGRLKLGSYALGGAKSVLAQSVKYAKERIAFGKPIAEFGLIQHKIAEMAAYLYAGETMTCRVDGMISEGASPGFSDTAGSGLLKAAEEFAIECSFVKIFGSEMLDYIVDEGVQIHGGYGYHQDYMVERAYRDSRINRIFEGTNEINRLLAAGMLLKRAQKKQLALVEAVRNLQRELLQKAELEKAPHSDEEHADMEGRVKKVALLLIGLAYQKFGPALEQEQEILAGITDVMMAAFALESCRIRAKRNAGSSAGETALLYTVIYEERALRDVDRCAAEIVAACLETPERGAALRNVRRLLKHDSVDVISIRRRLAKRVLDAGKYVV